MACTLPTSAALISAGELMLGRMPIVRNVYQGLKQIFESVVTASTPTQGFQKVGLMEFPSKGIWSLVFVTGDAAEQITSEIPGEDLISVFMPTGMLPPSGFVCFVPRSTVISVHMSVEDAAKIIISAGMVNPETQARLQDLGFYTGLVDGHFGLQTHNGLMSYQREYGLSPDGICGPETLRSLYFLGSRVSGGSPHAIREEELVRRSGPRLSGKRIIIDPGRGGADHGQITHGSAGPISEADILWDLASRLEGRMTAIGMETFLSRPPNRSPSDAERAATANTVGADLMISLRCATQASPSANGVASFHFGNSHGSVSTIGRNLSDFIQREVVARTGLRDCRTHGRTWDLLRLTRMPTVQVDVGYITNPRDRAMLVSTQTRDSVAEGILAAVKRLYLLGKNDRPTGTFTFAELLAHELSVDQAGRVSPS
jgi:N-acetylmuramoyl-L-alanine amidase